ncbi:hypothetical protein JOE59_002873 [Agromyces cerinus]|nr:hypothetical protein [Agromyces cerinus]
MAIRLYETALRHARDDHDGFCDAAKRLLSLIDED